jgi:hypothetical protein
MKEDGITISACIVVYKEEKLIVGLLENIKNFVDEIVLVYDGVREEDFDNTIDIASNFCQKNHLLLKVFKRPHIGEAEPHRPFSFKQASGEWILWIDADERIVGHFQDVKIFIKNNPNVSRIRFLLGTPQELKENTHKYRPSLFKINSICYFGIPHAKPILLKGENCDYSENIKILHLIEERTFKESIKKSLRWSKIYADTFFTPIERIEKFNTTNEVEVQFDKDRKRKRIWAFFYLIPATVLIMFRSIFFRKNFKLAIVVGSFVFMSYFYLITLQLKNVFKK